MPLRLTLESTHQAKDMTLTKRHRVVGDALQDFYKREPKYTGDRKRAWLVVDVTSLKPRVALQLSASLKSWGVDPQFWSLPTPQRSSTPKKDASEVKSAAKPKDASSPNQSAASSTNAAIFQRLTSSDRSSGGDQPVVMDGVANSVTTGSASQQSVPSTNLQGNLTAYNALFAGCTLSLFNLGLSSNDPVEAAESLRTMLAQMPAHERGSTDNLIRQLIVANSLYQMGDQLDRASEVLTGFNQHLSEADSNAEK